MPQACESLKAYLGRVVSLTGGEAPPVLLVGGSARIKGLKKSIEAQCECQALWWERSEVATALGAVPVTAVMPPPPDGRQQYRAAVELVWLDGMLSEAEGARLAALAKQLGLDAEQTADIERAVMGESREALLGRTPGKVFRDKLRDGSEGPELVVVPAGQFLMGSRRDEPGRYDHEGTQHRVTFAKPFAIGRYAVSFEEYDGYTAPRRAAIGQRTAAGAAATGR